MRAVVFNAAKDLDITDVPEPAGPDDGQVTVQVGYNGICGTDLHEYLAGPILIPTEPHPLTGRTLPVVLGHEFAGTVTAVGAGVTDLAEGDRVAIEPVYRCDECETCLAGRYNVCAKVGFHGLSIDGGMAEYTTVQARMAHKLPDSVSTELGALVEPMSVAYHAAKKGEVRPDRTALVFGAGPIGIGLWFALRGQGVEDVLVVEPSQVRRESIERLGARTLDPTSVDIPSAVADHTNGRMADAAYDAAGVAPAVEAALASIGPTRTMVSVAISEKPLETTLLHLVMGEKRIQGTLCYTADDYRAVIDLMAQGHYDTTGWVEQIALTDVVTEGFDALHAGRKMKVLVDPSR
jgi:(R,R)-butanediol dehydrogenase / meso-butanediol dehydrogenase / diacetyl reductase